MKDKYNQQQIPTIWRDVLVKIVKTIKDNCALNNVQGVCPVSDSLMQEIRDNVSDYGGVLSDLDDKTWKYSACQWMLEYWDVIVVLNTVEEGLSDLSLFVRVFEEGSAYEFEVISIHVQ